MVGTPFDMTQWIVGGVAAIGVLAFFVWLWSQPHPEKTPHDAGAPVDPDTDTYPPGSRPAGPGAETQRPDGLPSGGDGYPESP